MFHILVVDDDKNTRKYISAVLEAEHPVTGEKILLTSRPEWAKDIPDSVLLMDDD